MKYTITLFFLLFYSSGLFTQELLEGTVIGADTRSPLPYVNIGITPRATGTVSDAEGRYRLKIPDPADVVTFSSIGYETVEVKASELQQNGVVALRSRQYPMPIVEVVATKLGEERIFGVRNKTRGHSVGFGSQQLGTEIGAPIEIEAPTYLHSAHFVLNHAKGDSMLFRVNIYKFEDGQIGENLLRENIFIRTQQKKGTIRVDLVPYDLVLESDVLLSLEWIRDDDGEGNVGITFDTKKAKKPNGIYMKQASLGAFQQLPYRQNTKPCFYFTGRQDKNAR